jgi:hypothetical protein
MKRALVLRAACAIIGTALSVLACSSSNPTLPPGVIPLDSGHGERGIVHEPDTMQSASEAGTLDEGSAKDAQDATRDVPILADATAGIDSPPASTVTVTILSPAAVGPADAGAADGGASIPPVIGKSDRLAPQVQVVVQSLGGDPTLDVVTLVKATLLAAGGTSPIATITLNQTQYSVVPESGSKVYIYADTPFDLSGIAGDFYDLQVTATTAGGIAGTATLRIYVDGGPIITFLQPADAAYVKGSVVVTAMVVDSRSSIANVTFSIGQNVIAPKDIAINSASQYSTTIDFASYNPPLDGLQIVTVTATNGNGNVSVATRKFTIDNDGPTISATKPATGDMIGKIISIEAMVDDPAGVMKSSVVAVVANGDVHFEINLVQGTDGIYRNLFDTTQLPSYAIFPSLSFRAQDVLGNESSMGYLVSLDNTPPILDLDPPANFQLIRKDGICSWPLDPVGPDAVDDGAVVTQLFDIRARIEDRGNTPLTGTTDFIPIAAVDPATVKLLILDDTSLPLVVDTSDPPDGICDDINPDLVPSVSPLSSKAAQLIDMVPLPANAGSGDYTPLPGSNCSGKDTSPPLALCDTTLNAAKYPQYMTYLLGYAVNLALPSIWTIAPVVADGLRCAGTQFDASNNLKDGWACLAVEASDKLGNKQVSRPIRICVVGQPGSTACAAAASGGADIASVLLPSDATRSVLITTKAAVLGSGGAAIAAGDNLIFSRVSPTPFSVINGTHTVSPADTSGTKFNITNLSERPITLYVDNLDGKDPVSMGNVGVLGQDGAEVSVVTDTPATVLDPSFAGKEVVLMASTDAPKPQDTRWGIHDIQPTGFKLTGSTIALKGVAIPPANLPDCTGTVVKQTSGSKVDGTKPCKPWASYPKYEALYLK